MGRVLRAEPGRAGMTRKPTGKPRGPKRKHGLPAESLAFVRENRNDLLPSGESRLVNLACEKIETELGIAIPPASNAYFLLEAALLRLEFLSVFDLSAKGFSENQAASRRMTTSISGKDTLPRHIVLLFARAYESAAGKSATITRKQYTVEFKGEFLKFAKIVIQIFACPLLPYKTDKKLAGLIERSFKLKNDPAYRRFEYLSIANLMTFKASRREAKIPERQVCDS